MDFQKIKTAVAAQFEKMKAHDKLFVVDVSKDDLWATYLSSFPEGTNPIFRERTDHDCSCCRAFIKNIGGVVSIKDGKVNTIWDVMIDEPAYQAVANALANLVRHTPIRDIFLHYEKSVGVDKTFEEFAAGKPRRWDHFFVNLPASVVAHKGGIATTLGEVRSTRDVMLRGLNEITDEAVDTVLELIAQGSLYRGEEHKFAVSEFKKLRGEFKKSANQNLFAWQTHASVPPSVSRIRNTAIGTLLTDLSEGVDLEAAVRKFEVVMAPANYKRPTALVTKSMIEAAKKTVEELGLTSALERRYAKLSDITVNNILFADRGAKKIISGLIFDELKATKTSAANFDKVEDVPIEKFISDILPNIDSIEVMVENRHTPNFVSLIAPADPTAGKLFKWDNRFSWSYNGEMADSIKERVKAAGGAIDGDVCCRLAWWNTDDLDLHMTEPNRHKIYYGNRRETSPCGGMLDLDANGADGMRKDPAENIVYKNKGAMRKGEYLLEVHQFSRRNTTDVGFEVELEVEGATYNFVYDKALQTGSKVAVAKIRYDGGKLEVIGLLPNTQTSKTIWGLTTQQFHRASVVMMSPNHWDEQAVGNKHYFFMIDGATNEAQARGFYNEFIKSDLDKHRRVLELVGTKAKVADDPNQLSGLGFSSTQRNNLLCRVKGSFTRTIRITF
jgi:hypothetical protein